MGWSPYRRGLGPKGLWRSPIVTKGTPRAKYPYKTGEKDKAKSYELRLAAQFGDEKAKGKLRAYNRRIKERKMEANKSEWVVEGRHFNRYKLMDFIVARVGNGESLPQVCASDAMPSILEVYGWFDNHPEFEKAYKRAEEVRGHLLGEQALKTALDTDRENVAADKLKFEALSKAAARLNTRYQDKVQVQNVDEFANMSEEQIKNRIRMMLSRSPELSDLVPAGVLSGNPTSKETESQDAVLDLPSLDLVQTDTPDEDAD